MFEIDLIVTRHPGLVEYLVREKIVDPGVPIKPDAGADDVRGKVVAGVLPLHLVAECKAFLHIPLQFPRDSNMRGRELTADEVAQYAGDPVWYRVQRLDPPSTGEYTRAEAREIAREIGAVADGALAIVMSREERNGSPLTGWRVWAGPYSGPVQGKYYSGPPTNPHIRAWTATLLAEVWSAESNTHS